jgi:hypothetical protein
MQPACIVASAAGLLCRGANTVEANTTYARTAQALYGPGYGLAPTAMRIAGIGRAGLRVLPDDAPVSATAYFPVTVGPGPYAVAPAVRASATTGTACPAAAYHDATDPADQPETVYCGT